MTTAGPSADENDPESRLARLLADFDDRLKNGSAEMSPLEPPTDLPPSAQGAWERARACLGRLEQVWPRKSVIPAAVPPNMVSPGGVQQKLGRFEIRRELGHGGFGTVYLAYDPQLERDVALKVPHARVYADPDLQVRFDREARMAAGLDHPHIVPVFEAGVVDSVGYIVLAYCPGITLYDWLRRRVDPLPGPEIAEFIATLANAIQHAHEQSVIHRDLKPANVLLGGRDADDAEHSSPFPSLASFTPKITDFGLAKQLDSDYTHTHTGSIAGTPCYMAPEQTGAYAGHVGPATDVYSLGAILYELLTGRAPFLGESVLDTLEQVRYQDPIAPRRLRPGVPRDLEIICLKCLEKDPHRRYGSAKCLEDDLRRYQAGQSIAARPTGHITQVAKWARRRPAAAALIVVSAGALLVLAGSDLHVREKNRQTQRALAREIEVRGQLADTLASERLARYYHQIRLANAALADSNVRQAENYLRACLPAPGEPDHRGWEWDYLQSLTHGEQLWFRQHRRSIYDVALSADGTRCLSISDDGEGKCWDTDSGQLLWTFSTGNQTRGTQGTLAFSPTGMLVATGELARDMTELRHADDGQLLHQLPGCHCRFNSDGCEVATIDEPPTRVRVFHTLTGKEIRSFALDDSISAAVVIHKEVTCVATVASDFTIHIRRFPENSQFLLRGLSASPASPLAISSEATTIACGSHDGTLRIWDLSDGRVLAEVAAHPGMIAALQYSPDGQHVVTTGALGAIRIWNLRGRLLRELPGHGYFVNALAYNGDGRRLASAGADASVKVWDAEQDPKAIVLKGHTAFVYSIDFSPQAGRLASAGTESLIKLWDPASGQLLDTLTEQVNATRQLQFTGDGDELVGCDGYGRIGVWAASSGRLLRQWPPHSPAEICQVALGGRGRWMAAESLDRSQIIVRDTATGQYLANLPTAARTNCLAFTRNGQQLAIAGADQSIQIWDWEAARRRHILLGHKDRVNCLAFSWDGKYLASGGGDELVLLWNMETGERVLSIPNQWGRSNVFALAFSPDGTRLAAGRLDANVMLWDVSNGHEVLELPCRSVGVTSLEFTADGRQLAAVVNDGSIMIWNSRLQRNRERGERP